MYNFFLILITIIFVSTPYLASAANFDHLSGRIFLQVEKNGEAWYVSPGSLERYFLGRPTDAFALMREHGVGITNANLEKIPVALDLLSGKDSDGDGLGDDIEKALGTNHLKADTDNDGYNDLEELRSGHDPKSDKFLTYNLAFTAGNLGRIFLQIESAGEAWYVFPGDSKRYYLGRPTDAFNIMRNLSLGISDKDLEKLTALSVDFNLSSFEKKIHDLVNQERASHGLGALSLNMEVSNVAREHSQNLANENENFTGISSVCSYPLIHHEGLDFGIYQGDRLANRGIKYYNMSGENIALLSSAAITLTYTEGSIDENEFERCAIDQTKWDSDFKEAMHNEEDEDTKIQMLKEEVDKRETAFAKTTILEINSAEWQEEHELAVRAVDGWMNSPGHRANILKGEYDEAGMGVAYVNSYVIITQVFIRKIDCGYEGAACCERDNYLVCYQPSTCVDSICQ